MQVRHSSTIVPFIETWEAKREDDVVPDLEQLRFPEPEEAAMQEDREIQPLAPLQVDNEVDRPRSMYVPCTMSRSRPKFICYFVFHHKNPQCRAPQQSRRPAAPGADISTQLPTGEGVPEIGGAHYGAGHNQTQCLGAGAPAAGISGQHTQRLFPLAHPRLLQAAA